MIWYAYLLATLFHLGRLFNFLFSANATVSSGYGFFLIYSTLFALVQLTLVRILLELALKFLITARARKPMPRDPKGGGNYILDEDSLQLFL